MDELDELELQMGEGDSETESLAISEEDESEVESNSVSEGKNDFISSHQLENDCVTEFGYDDDSFSRFHYEFDDDMEVGSNNESCESMRSSVESYLELPVETLIHDYSLKSQFVMGIVLVLNCLGSFVLMYIGCVGDVKLSHELVVFENNLYNEIQGSHVNLNVLGEWFCDKIGQMSWVNLITGFRGGTNCNVKKYLDRFTEVGDKQTDSANILIGSLLENRDRNFIPLNLKDGNGSDLIVENYDAKWKYNYGAVYLGTCLTAENVGTISFNTNFTDIENSFMTKMMSELQGWHMMVFFKLKVLNEVVIMVECKENLIVKHSSWEDIWNLLLIASISHGGELFKNYLSAVVKDTWGSLRDVFTSYSRELLTLAVIRVLTTVCTCSHHSFLA